MKQDKLSDNWLFQQHSKQTITTWVRKLKYFSFTRAWSMYANDGDAFRVEFIYTDKQDLIHKITQLGLVLNTITVEFPIHATEGTDLLTTQKQQPVSTGLNTLHSRASQYYLAANPLYGFQTALYQLLFRVTKTISFRQ